MSVTIDAPASITIAHPGGTTVITVKVPGAGAATPSPDGTSVTTVGPTIIDAALRSFAICAADASNKGQQVEVNGVRDTRTGQVIRLYAKGGACSQENTFHNWYALDAANVWHQVPNPTGETPPVTPPVTPPTAGVPGPANDVGYRRAVLSGKPVLGPEWYAIAGAHISTDAAGNMVVSGGGSNYNNQVNSNKKISGGFYAEAEVSWTGTARWYQGATGWPSFWSTDIGAGLGKTNVEADFLEAMSGDRTYDFCLHNWNPDGSDTNTGSGTGSPGAIPPGAKFSDRHRFGFLFVPPTAAGAGYAKWFFDGQQIGRTLPILNGGLYSTLATQPSTIIFGSGEANPATFYSVGVWQA